MRAREEIPWQNLKVGDVFSWAPDDEPWKVSQTTLNLGVVARPWRPPGWPDEKRRPPTEFRPMTRSTVWRWINYE